MYTKYNYGCSQPRRHPTSSVPYMPAIVAPGSGAIPESQRVANGGCKISVVSAPTPITCKPNDIAIRQVQQDPTTREISNDIPIGYTAVDNGAYQRIETLMEPTPVNVGTIPVSATLRRVTQQIQANESDPYNPVTRFAKYFPAPPPPLVCPERLPSNEPMPSTTPCQPIQRFQGSAVGR